MLTNSTAVAHGGRWHTVLPHTAHAGRTPDEVYFDQSSDVPDELADARKKAKEARLLENRQRECHDCAIDQAAA